MSVPSAIVVVSRRHPGIHRHPAVCRHGSTPQMARGSLNPRASPIRGQDTSQATPSLIRSIYITHGSRLRPTQIHPRDLEHSRYTPRDIHQQIRRTCPPHVSRSRHRSSAPPARCPPSKVNISPLRRLLSDPCFGKPRGVVSALRRSPLARGKT